ncbi:MAG: 16S rRNA (cytosine(967)-C(5))-methyltransferase RsmB [Verrucomicrobia bacterium]|nr:16S rRNA (cytosine(967)-C(5))-methyltransferase RsmB [Verrucomicrobiota bacterium]MBU4247024.1 16S rRNA (cytosine(967)-C(5))-methyltransferase RsmB [Verrucomicrobiota bacterium]MBU4290326.1 16S rRNA (cytosine(967)-C(5))-methyltransferase RsmB [Verrucomicrobiota bacterium]MBU4429119.1 16S rRNA (cytosine(967)-C(5))-methyltransferase RsmB [Verrucomicrobiota bacterium]MCG2681774.1 16S rRNA (cytosine(967)-C(5))-methyltransferase RsmB [Kiritimatiellia bacterium]
MPTSSRQIAAQIIARWLKSGEFPNRLIPPDTPDRGFVMELVYGVVRWKRMLEWVAAARVHHMPEPGLRALMLAGLYQVLVMTKVEPYAAVNETVEAVKGRYAQGEADFVNALLRIVLREKEAILQELKKQPLGIQQSHPDMLVERWVRVYGEDAVRRLCEWNNTRPEVMIHVNSLKINPRAYLEQLQAKGMDAPASSAGQAGCLAIPHGWRVEELPGYNEGLFLVLDPSVLISVAQLDPRPGDHVLDACAAPGGKTFLMAERLQGRGRLTAMDLHNDRLFRLRANLSRLGVDGFVNVVQGNAMNVTDEAGGPFDRILLDAPCTNTGVIRRRPDARWRFSESRLSRMTRTQHAMLERVSDLLKPGGRLVYSTCSLEPEEDELLVASFLKAHGEFQLVSEQKIVPPAGQADGAYVASLQKQL